MATTVTVPRRPRSKKGCRRPVKRQYLMLEVYLTAEKKELLRMEMYQTAKQLAHCNPSLFTSSSQVYTYLKPHRMQKQVTRGRDRIKVYHKFIQCDYHMRPKTTGYDLYPEEIMTRKRRVI